VKRFAHLAFNFFTAKIPIGNAINDSITTPEFLQNVLEKRMVWE